MSGTKFFRNFPKVNYNFGDNELPVSIQNLSVYVDAFDQVKEYKAFYQNYQIKNNQRPDQLSHELYGTTDYYWTFFLMNEKLRERGWPINNSQLYKQAGKYYPNIVVTTDGTVFDTSTGETKSISKARTFKIGQYVWLSTLKKAAKIIRIEDNLSQYYLETDTVTRSTESTISTISDADALYINNTDPNFTPTIIEQTNIVRVDEQRNAIHHYEDVDGNWVYPTYDPAPPYAFQWSSVNTVQSVSYFERFRELNEETRSIRILKPDTIIQVISEYNALLKAR